jgi:hypothetical protein
MPGIPNPGLPSSTMSPSAASTDNFDRVIGRKGVSQATWKNARTRNFSPEALMVACSGRLAIIAAVSFAVKIECKARGRRAGLDGGRRDLFLNDRGAGLQAFGGVLIGRLRLGRHRDRLIDPGRCWQKRRGRATKRKALGVSCIGCGEDLSSMVPFLLRDTGVDVVRQPLRKTRFVQRILLWSRSSRSR